MTTASLDELGPVDYVVVEFPAGASNFTGEMATELLALVDAGIIRLIDALDPHQGRRRHRRRRGALRRRRARRAPATRDRARRAPGRRRRRPPRCRHGSRYDRRRAHLGEPVGRAVRGRRPTFGWPADRQRSDPHPGHHRLDRGRRSSHEPRRLNMPLRPARVGRVGVIGAPVAKTAVVAAAVTPGPSPVAKTAVVAAAVTPGRRRRI